ncbi:unnamed protein product [Paramecium octaurelia]|uniref:Uncharacterized protein n=1 Tax=Paramecium octaurelia TaxID=43137 RepID=A0A8S1WR66_PAROT|nr:unnamed protein product [Paramecium octaurelia]
MKVSHQLFYQSSSKCMDFKFDNLFTNPSMRVLMLNNVLIVSEFQIGVITLLQSATL